MKIKRFFTLLLAVIMIAGLLAGCGGDPEKGEAAGEPPAGTESSEHLLDAPLTFKVSWAEDGNNVVVIECQKAFDKISELTNGDLLFEYYPSGALGSITDVGEQIKLGAPIIHSFGMDGLGEYCTDLNPLSVMYMYENYDEYFALMGSDWMTGKWEKLKEDANLVVIGTGISGWRSYISSKPIRSGEDMKGMNIRMGPAAVTQGFVTLLGGSPFTAAWADNYTNIQTGIYDACEGPLNLLYSSSLYEVAPYLTLSEHTLGNWLLAMSYDYWDQIPDEYRQIVTDSLAEAAQEVLKQVEASDQDYVDKFEQVCKEVIVPDKSTFTWVTPKLLESLGFEAGFYDEVRGVIDTEMHTYTRGK